MQGRLIAIGDIHGCAIAFASLLAWIAPRRGDTLVILGDCIDRGPDSHGVIAQLLDLQDRCHVVAILGNHEQMLLEARESEIAEDMWLGCGGAATIRSYQTDSARGIDTRHIEFLDDWHDYWDQAGHVFLHANYDPAVPLDRQIWSKMRWISLHDATPARHVSGKRAIVGHSSQKDGEILELPHLVCIDTYCVGGGWLTALDVLSDTIWQVDAAGTHRAW